jgi:hypothetical protein
MQKQSVVDARAADSIPARQPIVAFFEAALA